MDLLVVIGVITTLAFAALIKTFRDYNRMKK